MATHELSPREEEIVELAIEGLTNEAIGQRLEITTGTVNTYWLRIRLKVGGMARTDSVARVVKDRADKALRAANVDLASLEKHITEREHALMGLRAELALLQLAMEQIRSTVWVADLNLTISVVANGDMPTEHCGVVWETGKTVFDIFKSDDATYPPIKAHHEALNGHESTTRLQGEFSKMVLRALPLRDEDQLIVGCIGIMNYAGD